MGYAPRYKQADAAWLGIGVHEAFAQWYKKGKRRGERPADFFERWAGDEIAYAKTYLDDQYDAPVWEDATELGIVMLEGYYDLYGRDPSWSFISTEQAFEITIVDHGEPVAKFRSRWDGVFKDLSSGRIKLLETKTATHIDTSYLDLDDQGGSYFAVAGYLLRANKVLKPGEEIEEIVYNFLRKARPDERPRDENGFCLNKDGSISKQQPRPLFHREPVDRSPAEVASQLQRIADEVRVMNAYRDGTLNVIKTPTKDCARYCPMYGPCVLDERGSDSVHDVLRSNFIQVNPYEDNRKSA